MPNFTPLEQQPDREFEPPELHEQNLDLWLTELAGRHRIRVRQLAEMLESPEVSLPWLQPGP